MKMRNGCLLKLLLLLLLGLAFGLNTTPSSLRKDFHLRSLMKWVSSHSAAEEKYVDRRGSVLGDAKRFTDTT